MKTAFGSPLLRKVLFFTSSLALLFLLVRANIWAVAGISAWIFIMLRTFGCSGIRVSPFDRLLSLFFAASLSLFFYDYWRHSSKVAAMADYLGLDIRVFLAGTAVLLGIVSVWVLAKTVASFSKDIHNISEIAAQDGAHVSLREGVLIFIIAVLTVTLFSKSSPCYPLNDWVDTNIFLTVGKSLLHGQVLYVDIYEQKGPLLFFIFVLPALISETSFIGVYFLEIISAFFFLLFSYKISRMFCGKESLFFLPAYAFIVYSTASFAHGGSVEELCLPMLTCALYYLVDMFKSKTEVFSVRRAFITGIFIGCILWIKYTMLGMFFGLTFVIVVLYCKNRRFSELWHTALAVIAGILLVTIPVLLYFALHHALNALWTVYFYNNMFIYGVSEKSGTPAQ